MRILLLGYTGQLGFELLRTLAPLGEIVALDYPQVNLADADQVVKTVQEAQPQVIINATAYTAVDRAEQEVEVAMAVNARAPGILAELARQRGAALVHYSTDYVFDGALGRPYRETDAPNPLGVYGKSKLEGERAIQQVGGAALILRTSWVYSLRRDSFVTKVLEWSRKQTTLRLVTDQVSGPTWCRMLAEITAQFLASAGNDPVGWLGERAGLYHLAGDGYTSRLAWGKAILALDHHPEEQIVQEVLAAVSDDFPTPARRPLFSALNCDLFASTFGLRLPPWQQALQLALEK